MNACWWPALLAPTDTVTSHMLQGTGLVHLYLIKSLVLASVDALIEGSDPGLLLLAAGRLEFDVTDLVPR